jgi:hypothetical protein
VTAMLSPFALPLRTALSAAKGLRVNSAKHPRICKAKEIRGFFLRFTQDRLRLLRMTGAGIVATDPNFFTASEALRCYLAFSRRP